MTSHEQLAKRLRNQADIAEVDFGDAGSARLMRQAANALLNAERKGDETGKFFDFYWSDGRPCILNPLTGHDARNFALLSLEDRTRVLNLKPGGTCEDEQGNTWKRREGWKWTERPET